MLPAQKTSAEVTAIAETAARVDAPLSLKFLSALSMSFLNFFAYFFAFFFAFLMAFLTFFFLVFFAFFFFFFLVAAGSRSGWNSNGVMPVSWACASSMNNMQSARMTKS